MGKGAGIVVALIVVVLLGFGVWAYLWMDGDDVNGNGDEEADTSDQVELDDGATDNGNGEDDNGQATEADHEVVYDGSSFSSAEITVEQGDTVVFVNDSDFGMWPASDPHPQHTDLPEFDAGGNVQPGEEYAFTFEEVGQWGYHDHSNSSVTGTVIVE